MSSNIADEIVIRIRADLEKFKGEIIAANGSLKQFDESVKQTGVTTQKLDAGLKAFSWTTFSQGALNTSTALAQLYTSISNIAKIQYTMQAALIGVERAEDLVARKTLQLSNEMERNGVLSKNAILLRNELATATDDLIVKNERVKIAQDAVNDTYILFTSNVVNTVFGTMQTLIGLKTMLATRTIANSAAVSADTIATNANTIAKGTNAGASGASIAANTGLGISFGGLTGAISLASVAIKGYTIAMLTSPLAPVAIAAIAAGIAFMAYQISVQQTETEKLTKSVNDLGTTQNSTISINNEFGSSISTNTSYLGEYSDGIDKLSSRISELKKRIEETSKTLQDQENNPFQFLFGGVDKTLSENIGRFEKELSVNKKQYAMALGKVFADPAMTEELNKAILGGYTSQVLQGGSNVQLSNMILESKKQLKPILQDIINLMEEEGVAYDVAANTMLSANDKVLTALGLKEDAARRYIDNLYEEARANETVANTSKMRFEQEIKYLKEISELKKKTSPRFLAELKKTTLDQLAKGNYGLSPDVLEKYLPGMTREQIEGLGYQPFRGYFNEKTKQMEASMELTNLDNILKSQTGLLQTTMETLSILPYGHPARKQYEDAVRSLNSNIKNTIAKANSEINIVGGGIGGQFMKSVQSLRSSSKAAASLISFGQKSGVMYNLEQAQLEHQRKYGVRVPVPGRINVDVSGMQVSNWAKNAEDLASYGAVSTLGTNYAERTRFGAAAVSAGMVSVSEVVGGAARFRARNAQALAARRAEIAEEDAWRNSVEGQLSMLANALLTGGTFAFSSRVARSLARSGGGLSMYQSNVLRAAGLLGVSVPYEGFKTTANEVFTGAAAGLSLIVKEAGVREEFLFAAMNALQNTATEYYKSRLPMGWSSIRDTLGAYHLSQNIRTMTSTNLQNYVGRVAAGNFGIYDATVLNAMTGATVSELANENEVFNNKIAPLLNIAHSDFKTTLVDPKRGINEIDDRIRWTQRLEQISTGATVF